MRRRHVGFRSVYCAILVAVFLVGSSVPVAVASQPFDLGRRFPPKEAHSNMLIAMMGGYQKGMGNDLYPVLPKGFPQWGMSPEEALRCVGKDLSVPTGKLGDPRIIGKNCDRYTLVFLDDRFVGIACIPTNRDEITLRGITGWKETEAYSEEPDGALLVTTFVPVSGHLCQRVYTWSAFKNLRFYVTEEAARVCGVIR